MGSKSKAPTAPNMSALLPQQQAANDAATQKTDAANRITQIGPDNQKITYDPTTGAQTVTRGAADQALTDTRNANQQQAGNMVGGLLGQAQNTMANPLDTSGMTGYGANSTTSNFGSVKEVQDAMMSRLQPDLERRREAEMQRARNAGVPVYGSAAGGNMLDALNRSENDASMQALLKGVDAQNTLFNQGLAGNASADRQRAQQLQEAQMLRQMPLNEAQMLQGMSGTNTDPKFNNFVTSAGYKAPDIVGAAQADYKAQMDAYNAKNASKSNVLGGVMGLAGSVLGGPVGGMLGSSLGGLFGGASGTGAANGLPTTYTGSGYGFPTPQW